jgi:hypothetical protein
MESDANTRLSRGFNGMIGLVSAVDLARLRAESDAAAQAADHAAGSPGAVSGGAAGRPVAVLRDRNLRTWVALLVGLVVLACIVLLNLFAAASRPEPALRQIVAPDPASAPDTAHSAIGSEQ